MIFLPLIYTMEILPLALGEFALVGMVGYRQAPPRENGLWVALCREPS
jgi:hypothetical protein